LGSENGVLLGLHNRFNLKFKLPGVPVLVSVGIIYTPRAWAVVSTCWPAAPLRLRLSRPQARGRCGPGAHFVSLRDSDSDAWQAHTLVGT
jgi:hypothetical protein